MPFHATDARLCIPGLNYNNSRIRETDSRDPETEAGSLETELIVHRIHATLDYMITGCPSQPCDPSADELVLSDRACEGTPNYGKRDRRNEQSR